MIHSTQPIDDATSLDDISDGVEQKFYKVKEEKIRVFKKLV